MKFKNYRNKFNGNNKIYSRENIWDMPLSQLFKLEKILLAQNSQIGIPTNDELRDSDNISWDENGRCWSSRDVIVDVDNQSSSSDNGNTSGCVGSYPVSGYTRADGTVVDDYVRTCGAAHAGSEEERSEKEENTGRDDENQDINTEEDKDSDGNLTGEALPIVNRKEEHSFKEKNNDKLFEKEASKFGNILMQYNHDKNKDRPDAKLLMDIALIDPKRVPSCKDYQFISADEIDEYNKKYNLDINQNSEDKLDGFIFSEESPTAKRLNGSIEFKNQIFREDNYDSETGKFKRDKLQIELKDDTNLHYSFGHMTIINPKITSDGYVVGMGYDIYDFEKVDGSYSKDKTILYNNSAASLQNKNFIKPYCIYVPVKVKIK